jgi:two-component system, NarL family, sensor kinase
MQAGLARNLLRTDPDAADQELTELREELRAAVADIRRLVYGLRPPALDELGLVGALRARLARLDRGGIEADSPALQVDLIADDSLPPLSAAAEVATFRIIEEAVTNVVKHAQATHAVVTLRVAAEDLLITISDDGVGLSSTLESSGLGLQSMRERATEIGGSCTVTTNPDGRGTLVRVTVPILPTPPSHGTKAS